MIMLPMSGRLPVKRFDFGVSVGAGIHLDLGLKCRARSTRHSTRRLGVQGRRRANAHQAQHAQASTPCRRHIAPTCHQPVALTRLADLQAA
jgi:hypothetical protein